MIIYRRAYGTYECWTLKGELEGTFKDRIWALLSAILQCQPPHSAHEVGIVGAAAPDKNEGGRH